MRDTGLVFPENLPDAGQEAFLESLIEAFNEIGGVPVRYIRYDNLTSEVAAVVFGLGRQPMQGHLAGHQAVPVPLPPGRGGTAMTLRRQMTIEYVVTERFFSLH